MCSPRTYSTSPKSSAYPLLEPNVTPVIGWGRIIAFLCLRAQNPEGRFTSPTQSQESLEGLSGFYISSWITGQSVTRRWFGSGRVSFPPERELKKEIAVSQGFSPRHGQGTGTSATEQYGNPSLKRCELFIPKD